MLNDGIFILNLVNFGFIALLPRMFFVKGSKLDLQWWMTATPLFASPACLALAYWHILPPLIGYDTPYHQILYLVSAILSSFSVLMLGMSLGVHRIPIYMFHDQHDSRGASHLVTWGPYRFVRHPIYGSYLMALTSAAIFCPQVGTILCWLYGIIVLNNTAAKEEKKLSESPEFGNEYKEYIKHTGRFLPQRKMLLATSAESSANPLAESVNDGAGHEAEDELPAELPDTISQR